MITSATATALAWALVHFVWEGAVLGIVAAGVLRAARGRSAQLRHAIAHVALWAMAGSLIATIVALWPDTIRAHIPLGAPRRPLAGLTVVAILLAWSTGATIHAARLVRGLLAIARLRSRAVAVSPPWRASVGRLAAVLGVRTEVDVRMADGIDGPMVVGVLRPVILVPLAYAVGVPTPAIEAVLRHELAHVLRHDALLQLCAGAIEAVLFFHPAVRWLCRQLRRERELACDEIAIASGVAPVDYANALLELEQLRGGTIHPALALAARNEVLMPRILHALSTSPRSPARSFVAGWFALLAAVVPSAVVVACVTADEPAEPAPVVERTEVVAAPPVAATSERARVAPSLRRVLGNDAALIDLVEITAARHGIDPNLVAAVTSVESNGDPLARSPAGARGLMQLMPRTAEAIAAQRNLVDHHVDRLDDPAYNLDLGTYHLAELIDVYGDREDLDGGAVQLAAAAYNAGIGAVERFEHGEAPLPEEAGRYCTKVAAIWSLAAKE